jgi:hypothetical protein
VAGTTEQQGEEVEEGGMSDLEKQSQKVDAAKKAVKEHEKNVHDARRLLQVAQHGLDRAKTDLQHEQNILGLTAW